MPASTETFADIAEPIKNANFVIEAIPEIVDLKGRFPRHWMQPLQSMPYWLRIPPI